MKVTTWGTRGSLPKPMDDTGFRKFVTELIDEIGVDAPNGLATLKQQLASRSKNFLYGGNTSCVQVESKGGHSILFDMGTGLRAAGTKLVSEKTKEFHIFLTHLHWDHIMGLPFFLPLYDPGSKINFYHVHKNAEPYLKILFNGINFPLDWGGVTADVEFKQLKLYQPVKIDSLNVSPFTLDHPGGSFGYRVDEGLRSMVVGYDSEYKRLTKAELGKDYVYYTDLDLILFDAQYEMQNYASKFDWGHCTPTIGTGLALREGIKTLVLTHHDPWAEANTINRMLDNARHHVRVHLPEHEELWRNLNKPDGPEVVAAFDGMNIVLE